jgi:hypothetical protein
VRLRLLERVGSAIGFSPEGRSVRVWVQGMPGADETEVVPGVIESVRADGAVLSLHPPDDASVLGVDRVLAVPHEPGWGLQALWFSFIAVDVFALEGDPNSGYEPTAGDPTSSGPGSPESAARGPAGGEPLGRWFIRLGAPA